MGDAPGVLDDLAPWPQVDFAEFGTVESKPVGRIQQLTAKFLGRNWVAIPHVTHHDELDVTALETRRAAWNSAHPGSKVTLLAALIRATAQTLSDYPKFNASLDATGKKLTFKSYFHIGVAVDTPNGLLVPVLRDCETKRVAAIAAELAAVSTKAREKGLSLAEMSGGSITISSLGHIGGTAFTPIVNAPEVAIVGVTKIQLRPRRGEDDGIVWRQMLPVSLSYDHRVINGADAARLVVALGKKLDAVVLD